jgi:hypothetical protein
VVRAPLTSLLRLESTKAGGFRHRCGEVNAHQRVGEISHCGHTVNDGSRVRQTLTIDTHTPIGYHRMLYRLLPTERPGDEARALRAGRQEEADT